MTLTQLIARLQKLRREVGGARRVAIISEENGVYIFDFDFGLSPQDTLSEDASEIETVVAFDICCHCDEPTKPKLRLVTNPEPPDAA